VISALHNQAGIALRLTGQLEAAGAAYGHALDGIQRAGRLRSARAAAVYHNLGGLAFAEQRYADAERLVQRALLLNRRSLPPAALRVAADLGMLGAIVAAAGRPAEGERLLRDGLACSSGAWAPSIARSRWRSAISRRFGARSATIGARRRWLSARSRSARTPSDMSTPSSLQS
jgi:tetratricopeptide (TPR) repeat protein